MALSLAVLALLLAAPAAPAGTLLGVPLPATSGGHPGRPGVASAAVSSQAVAAAVKQSTGLSPSQLTTSPVCANPAPGQARCLARVLVLRSTSRPVHVRPPAAATFSQVFPRGIRSRSVAGIAGASPAAAPPQSTTPAFLQQAYDLAYLSATAGTGDTVAVVDAYDDPTAESDLAAFRSNFGLAACTTANGCFRKVNQSGQASPLPSGDQGWALEESLDLDAVSALCPNCHIILVEANSAYSTDLDTGVVTAKNLGAQQISNSYSSNTSTPAGQGPSSYSGVSVIASTGDHGYPGAGIDAYPASMPGFVAAGGTSLTQTGASSRGYAESAWSLSSSGWGGTSGCNLNEPKPAWQTDTGCTGRSYSDVSADADPYTGLRVYDTGYGGWVQMGGTSLSSPLIAAYEALTGIGGPSAQWAYQASSLLNDPVSGSSGSCAANIAYICNAGVGYDGPTGIGSISGDVVTGGPGVGVTSAQNLTATSETVNAGVYPNGLDTAAYWQYGTTASYGLQSSAVDLGAGATVTPTSSTLTGLAPSTTYHYRLVVQNSAGTTYGYDYTFTTPAAPPSPPVNSSLPSITGTTTQGYQLTALAGTWTPTTGISYAYQWQRSSDGGNTWTNLTGATSQTYTLGTADLGDMIQVRIVATTSGGSAYATSSAVGPVASGAPVSGGTPTISGAPAQGDVLNVNATFSGASDTYTYVWQRSTDGGASWQTISGATSSSYTVPATDEAATLRATVTAGNPFGQASATSAAVGPVTSNPPVNTVAPALTGTTQRTYTLRATAGTWTGPSITYSYQWQRSPDGSTWSNVSGATASTYTLTAADEGDVMRAMVSASNVDAVVSRPSAASVLISPFPPGNLSAPTISGTPERTYTLTATRGSWTGPDNTYSYQWQRDAGEGFVDIAGATATAYTLTQADESAVVRVVVTAANPDATVMEASQPTTTVLDAVPVNQTPPAVTGTAQRNSVLTAGTGTWGGAGNSYAFQWQRSADGNTWNDVSGATSSSYTIGAGDEGTALRVMVTATNADGSASTPSSATAAIQAAPPVNSTAPAIFGSPQRSSVLTSSPGTWGGIGNTYTYQWQRSSDGSHWANISGATGQSYTLAVADEGYGVRLAMTAANADGQLTVASPPTATVQAAVPVNTAVPTVTGTAQRSYTLNSSPGSWGGIGNVYTYQWERSANGTTWNSISGATTGSYTIGAGDEGERLRLTVTASNPDGSAIASSSATLSVAAAPPVSTTAPTIAGTAQRGSLLTSTQGTWGGIGNVYAYQWQRSADATNWTNIAGATGQTYTIAPADETYAIRLTVTATNPDATVTASSSPTSTVPNAAPSNVNLPTVTGQDYRGVVLTSTSGNWLGIGNSYVLQWQRSSDGSTWSNIPGASGGSYQLTTADEGDLVRLTVTASNVDGSATASSAATATVQAAPPVNATAPTVTGATQRTGLLSADPGSWGGVANSYTFQWQHNAGSGFTNIPGATGATYTLGVADENTTMRVMVSATNADGSASASSAATATVSASPPANLTVPTIAGTAQRTMSLTENAGTWTGIGNTYSVQWQRSADGTNWTSINGAVGASYTLGLADEGDSVRVQISAANPDGTVSVASAPSATVLAAPPSNTAPPTISGTAQRASTLNSSVGTWAGLGNTTLLQWQRSSDGTNWANIAGATSASYALGVADEHEVVRLQVTVTNADGSASAASTPSPTVTAAPPANSAPPSISGVAQRSSTLTSGPGTWSGVGNAYTYQWQRSSDGTTWSSVAGATASTYALGVSDEGYRVRLLVTATNPDGSLSTPSTATAPVTAAPPVLTGSPTLSGAPQRTQILSAGLGSWGGLGNTYTYQWQRSANSGASWSDIAGAVSPTYTLDLPDEGDNVRVVVTAANPDGTLSAPSPGTAPVQGAAPVNGAAPTITGSARTGSTLTAGSGSWTPAGETFAYQWQRGNGSGGFTGISGATSATYVPVSADIALPLRVAVTATNPDGSTSATSAATAPVASPPVNTVAPTAPTGTTQDGSTLTADPGTWTSAVQLGYSWLRCPSGATSADGSCAQVGSGASYVLTGADVGHPIAVQVTATSSGGATSLISPLTAAVQGRPLTSTSPPSISGDPQVPNPLSASPGTWSVTLTSLSYDWQRCDADGVSNCTTVATGVSHYTLSAADRTHTIVLVANATSPGRTATAQSAPLTVQDQPLPQPSTQPAVSGTAARADTLQGTSGTWTNSPSSIAYQWQRCDSSGQSCQPVAGANGTSYPLSAGDEGSTIVFSVTATNTSGSTTASTRPTAVVAAAPAVNTSPPVITGTAQQGAALVSGGDRWQAPGDTTFATQWLRCAAGGTSCQNISGATGSGYTPTAADVGHVLEVTVTGSNPDGSATATSQATSTILPAAPRWRALPTVSQDPGQVGDTVTVTPGTWSGPSLDTDTVELMRCTNTCGAVSLTGGSYTIVAGDIGAVLRVRETAVNAGGTTVVWSSSYIGPVSSSSSGSAVLASGRVTLRNAHGAPLAVAQLIGFAPAADSARRGPAAPLRVIRISRAPGVTGKLRAWACPVSTARGSAPAACTRQITLTGSGVLKLTATMTGRLRVVVVRARP